MDEIENFYISKGEWTPMFPTPSPKQEVLKPKRSFLPLFHKLGKKTKSKEKEQLSPPTKHVIDLSLFDIHSSACSLKKFLRDLPDAYLMKVRAIITTNPKDWTVYFIKK
jgi:hypothetical protein